MIAILAILAILALITAVTVYLYWAVYIEYKGKRIKESFTFLPNKYQ